MDSLVRLRIFFDHRHQRQPRSVFPYTGWTRHSDDIDDVTRQACYLPVVPLRTAIIRCPFEISYQCQETSGRTCGSISGVAVRDGRSQVLLI